MALKMFSGHTETEVTPKEQCVIPLHTDFFLWSMSTVAVWNLDVCEEINYWYKL